MRRPCQLQVYVLDFERSRKAEHNRALEKLARGLMIGTPEDNEVVVESEFWSRVESEPYSLEFRGRWNYSPYLEESTGMFPNHRSEGLEGRHGLV